MPRALEVNPQCGWWQPFHIREICTTADSSHCFVEANLASPHLFLQCRQLPSPSIGRMTNDIAIWSGYVIHQVFSWLRRVQRVSIKPRATRVIVRILEMAALDRKSTRLNSSHPSISYAVFCLKKKT